MAVAVPQVGPNTRALTLGRWWRPVALVVLLALLVFAAGVAGWAMRGNEGAVTVASAGRQYAAMVEPYNQSCGTPSMGGASIGWRGEGQSTCKVALLTLAATMRAMEWPEVAAPKAAALAKALETHAGWLDRMDKAATPEEQRVIVGELLAQRPLIPVQTANAARALRATLGLGSPLPML